MASSNGGSAPGEEELLKMAELSKTLKEGERILAPTRRPDGTLRKPIRIRAGYTPQEEVAIYQSKGALWKKEMASHDGPPGYDPELDAKPKTKAAKRNERKKEKRLQAFLVKDKNSEPADDSKQDGMSSTKDVNNGSDSVRSLASHMDELAVSSSPAIVSNPLELLEGSNPEDPALDIDKKIRALKKKVRLAEAQLQKTGQKDMKPEQLEKPAKLEGWHQELKLLEDMKAESARTLS